MKKKNLFQILIGSIAVVTGLSSCNKCQTCTYGSYSEEICQEDFDSKSDYKDYISYIESYGASCK